MEIVDVKVEGQVRSWDFELRACRVSACLRLETEP